VDGRREDVVRRLPHVHVVVGVHVLAGKRGDHLVRVHVRRGSRAGLEDIDRELVVELAGSDPVGGLGDSLRLVDVEEPELGIGTGRGGLDPPEPAGDGDRDGLARDGKVLDRFSRLGPPQLVPGRDLAHALESSRRALAPSRVLARQIRFGAPQPTTRLRA
jgi:hypothetical protein